MIQLGPRGGADQLSVQIPGRSLLPLPHHPFSSPSHRDTRERAKDLLRRGYLSFGAPLQVVDIYPAQRIGFSGYIYVRARCRSCARAKLQVLCYREKLRG